MADMAEGEGERPQDPEGGEGANWSPRTRGDDPNRLAGIYTTKAWSPHARG
jgi:hypothetical protein